jgi:hypothetical protein
MGIFDFFKKSKNIENYNGLNETYYNNGKGELKEKFTKKNGKKEGLYKTYYENGQLQSKYNFKNGKLDKLCKYWNDKGQLISEKNYKEGEKDGPHKSWFENGQLHIEVNYVNGNQEGLPKYYSENGQLKDKMFLDHIQKENKGKVKKNKAKVKKNKAKLKFKVGDLIKKKKGGNFEYEIISIKPRFNAVEIYLDVTGKRIMQTFQHINKEWELAQPAIKLDPLEDKGDKKVDSEDVAEIIQEMAEQQYKEGEYKNLKSYISKIDGSVYTGDTLKQFLISTQIIYNSLILSSHRLKSSKKGKLIKVFSSVKNKPKEIEKIFFDWESIKDYMKNLNSNNNMDNMDYAMQLESICFCQWEFGQLPKDMIISLIKYSRGEVGEDVLDTRFAVSLSMHN